MLMSNRDVFRTLQSSLLKTAAMLTGEFDYKDVIYPESNLDAARYVLFPLFFAVVVIVVQNLVFGFIVKEIPKWVNDADFGWLNYIVETSILLETVVRFFFSKRRHATTTALDLTEEEAERVVQRRPRSCWSTRRGYCRRMKRIHRWIKTKLAPAGVILKYTRRDTAYDILLGWLSARPAVHSTLSWRHMDDLDLWYSLTSTDVQGFASDQQIKWLQDQLLEQLGVTQLRGKEDRLDAHRTEFEGDAKHQLKALTASSSEMRLQLQLLHKEHAALLQRIDKAEQSTS